MPTRTTSIKGKKNKNHTLSPESELEKDDAPFALAGLYVLKVLFIDMTISLGDVCTDFWQVKYKVLQDINLKFCEPFHF